MPLNEMTRKNRGHKIAASVSKKKLTNKIKLLTMAQTRLKLEGQYDIRIVWTVRTKHDPDNIYSQVKYLLDGMVAAGLLPNDNRKFVRNIANEIQSGPANVIDVYLKQVKNL